MDMDRERDAIKSLPAIAEIFKRLPPKQPGEIRLADERTKAFERFQEMRVAGPTLIIKMHSDWKGRYDREVELRFTLDSLDYTGRGAIIGWHSQNNDLLVSMPEVLFTSTHVSEAPQGVSIYEWIGPNLVSAWRLMMFGAGCLAIIGGLTIIAIIAATYWHFAAP